MQLQVVQEELQELSHRLDSPPTKLGVSIGVGPEEDLHSSEDESLGGGAGQAQLRTRLKTLKTEYSELIGELRRRSSIVEGVPMSFEVSGGKGFTWELDLVCRKKYWDVLLMLFIVLK